MLDNEFEARRSKDPCHMMDSGSARWRPAHSVDRSILLLLLIAFLLITLLSSPSITVTLDEPLHYHYGLFVLDGKSDRIDDSSMPVSALNALPRHIASLLPEGMLRTILERYFLARLVTILFGASFAAVVFLWSESLYGRAAALVSALLYILDPNVIANSQLVTTDVFAAGMLLLSLYLLWRFANNRRTLDGILCSASIGFSQLAKYSAIALLPLGLAALLIHDWPLLREAYRGTGRVGLLRRASCLAVYVVLALFLTAIIVNLGFLLNKPFTRVGDYRFRSDLLRSIQRRTVALADLPLPLPYPYVEGLDWMVNTEQVGDRFGNVYLMGQLRKSTGFPGYYLVASALKLPVATQFILSGACLAYVLQRRRRRHFSRDEVFLIVPAGGFIIYFNFLFHAQTGMRYYLVVLPLLYVFAGSLFTNWEEWPARAKVAMALLLLYLAASVVSYFPYFTPYFNELVPIKTQVYKYLSDTNLEWGQSQDDLRLYLEEHKEAVYNPSQVQAGQLVVGGSDLVGILEDPKRYEWLRDNFEPVDTIAYCYFVYKISEDEVADLCSRTDYCD
jgi:hypothetical protein